MRFDDIARLDAVVAIAGKGKPQHLPDRLLVIHDQYVLAHRLR